MPADPIPHDAVIAALRAEAHSAPMPVISVGDVVLWDKGIEPVWEPVWKPSMAATWAKMSADEKAGIAAIERDGVIIWRREAK